jgi:hypothetical protein
MATASNMPLLVPDGLFTCPRCGPLATAKLLMTGSLNNLAAGRCNRCEHSYQFSTGNPSTTLTGSSNTAGVTALTVASGTSFTTVGASLVIDATASDGGPEVVAVSSAGGSTSIPIAGTPLRLTHAAGATVQTGTLVPLGSLT